MGGGHPDGLRSLSVPDRLQGRRNTGDQEDEMSDATHTTARQLVAPGKGILAADESTGTIKKRFDQIGVGSTEDLRRRYRQMLFTTPGLGEHISGVILFDETIRQATDDGVPFVKVLEARRFDPRDQGRHRGEATGAVPGRDRDRGARRAARAARGVRGARGSLREVAGDDPDRGGDPDRLRDLGERARHGALRGPLSGGRRRADRGAGDPHGRRPRPRGV